MMEKSKEKDIKELSFKRKNIRKFLMSNKDCIPIEEAIKEANKKWFKKLKKH